MIRITTNGTLMGYKSNLMKASNNLNSARDKVMTQRNFNSYAEDPAAATRAFQLRRAGWRTDAQLTNCKDATSKFESAFKTLGTIKNDLADVSTANALNGLNDAFGSGRAPLGSVMKQTANSIIQSLNNKYGENFIFSGSEGGQLPFQWKDDGNLYFRGINVSTTDPTEMAKLKAMTEEVYPIDMGLGLQEDANGNMVTTSVFNGAISGLTFMGYGVDQDGDPKNMACIVMELGKVLSRCGTSEDKETDGEWASAQDKEDATRLTAKLQKAVGDYTSKYAEMDTKASFLKTTSAQLELTADTLNEQILSIEQCDLADAISSFSWAQYSYNAALKVGNSILSESLMDYLR